MNWITSSSVFAARRSGFTLRPSRSSVCRSSLCEVTSRPAALYAHIARFRLAVAFGSSCRTARAALHELAIDVGQVDREPVDLELAYVVDVVPSQELAHALVEGAELAFIERVRQGKHRRCVLDRRESRRRRCADALRRRLGGYELGVGGLE